MGPVLHRRYTEDGAVAVFGGDTASDRCCDGQFVVLPGVVVCLATVGNPGEGPELTRPTCFVWRPARLDYEPGGEWPWLPARVREVWDRSGPTVRQVREHHVFLRTGSGDTYLYAGPAHLGSYGGNPDLRPAGLEAGFTLEHRLPREAWLALGGYPGWLVEVNHQEHRVAAGDRAALEALTRQLTAGTFAHLSMTRYEEDSLSLHTNADRGWLMYLRHPGDPGLYTRDVEYQGDPASQEFFECQCGIELEFPRDRTLPRDRAVRAAVEFFETGRLPGGLPWTPD